MATFDLALGRIFCRLEVSPKSLLYFGRRELFASKYYPARYGDWELSPTQLRLTDNKRRIRMNLDPDGIGFEADVGVNVPELQQHVIQAVQEFQREVTTGSNPVRFGWRAIFFLEHGSFDDLSPVILANTLGKGPGWWTLAGFAPRDLAHNVWYGTEDDGVNLQVGVLTPEQVTTFRRQLQFKGEAKELSVDAGALLVDLDRYVKVFGRKDQVERVAKDHDRLHEFARSLAQKVLAKA